MSEALYERYKEALRRGHVATLRGRLQEALGAYGEAASIAPERPLPHTSLGTVLLRLGRVDDALASFGAALERAPRDEGALLGRADALARAGRPAEASAALDVAADVQESAGRPLDALRSARRALELAESRARRGTVARLAATTAIPDADASASRPAEAAGGSTEAEAGRAGGSGEPAPEEAGTGQQAAGPAVAPEEETPTEPSAPADPVALTLEADAALESGDVDAARRALVGAAVADAAAGRQDAALDACYRALAVAPDDPELHLELVRLYVARGWRALAAEKLTLLERLVTLDGDEATIGRVRAAAAAAFLEDWRAGPGPLDGAEGG